MSRLTAASPGLRVSQSTFSSREEEKAHLAAAPPLPNGERVAAKRPGEGAGSKVSKRSAGATSRARNLRRSETEPEYRLWGELRNRHLNGHKFVRQMPLGPYVVDFLCREQCLIVEVDGSQHADSVSDVARDNFLRRRGYSTLRFWNDEILRERRAVLDTILAALEGRLTPSPGLRFAPATLSPPGRGAAAAISASSSPLGERVAAKRPAEVERRSSRRLSP
jgi:very-short-patch-repair endonuclease